MKRFEEPSIEVIDFVVDDIITTSGPNDDNAGEEDNF